MTDDSSWFGARILLAAEHPDEAAADTLFEERIVLIRAATDEAAREKAVRLGKAAEEAYENPDGKTVKWGFREVLDVKPLFDDVIGDGSEVYYSLLAEHDVEPLRRALQSGGLSAAADDALATPVR